MSCVSVVFVSPSVSVRRYVAIILRYVTYTCARTTLCLHLNMVCKRIERRPMAGTIIMSVLNVP